MMKGSPYESGEIPNRIAIGDVNGDGVNDIATSDNGSNKIYLFIMTNNGVKGRENSLSLRPSRTTNIFLFNGEANRVQAFTKPHC